MLRLTEGAAQAWKPRHESYLADLVHVAQSGGLGEARPAAGGHRPRRRLLQGSARYVLHHQQQAVAARVVYDLLGEESRPEENEAWAGCTRTTCVTMDD